MSNACGLIFAVTLLAGCHHDRAIPSPGSWHEGMARPRLKRLWRLPDLEVTTSVLDAQPADPTLLALGKEVSGKRDMVAVDVGRGTIRWRAPLDKWRGTALLAVGAWALTVDDRQTVGAFELRSGRPLWKVQLDCRFDTGEDVINQGEVLIGRCARDNPLARDRGEALAIDMRDGSVHPRGPWEASRYPASSIERHRSAKARERGEGVWAAGRSRT